MRLIANPETFSPYLSSRAGSLQLGGGQDYLLDLQKEEGMNSSGFRRDRKRSLLGTGSGRLFGALALLWFAFAAGSAGALELSQLEDLENEVVLAPCHNKNRLEAVRRLFEKMGAKPEDITIQEHRKVKNLIVTIPAASKEKIIIGAHYDKVRKGCGVIDNWTGIVTLAHIYRTMRTVPLRKTLVFVAFGREEEGLIGSRAMAQSLTTEEKSRICVMLNLDSFGLSWPQAANNLSTRRLADLAADLAQRMNIQFSRASVEGNADSTAFLEQEIPAITLHGLPNDFREVIHTHRDRAERIRPQSIYLAYRLAVGLVAELDAESCAAWR